MWPASSPYVTAIGATMNGPELTNSSEISCSALTSSKITTGGGFSVYSPAPSFQVDAIQAYMATFTADQSQYQAYNPSNRGFPDLSMPGSNYGRLTSSYTNLF
jgi:subtilase family serine protease